MALASASVILSIHNRIRIKYAYWSAQHLTEIQERHTHMASALMTSTLHSSGIFPFPFPPAPTLFNPFKGFILEIFLPMIGLTSGSPSASTSSPMTSSPNCNCPSQLGINWSAIVSNTPEARQR